MEPMHEVSVEIEDSEFQYPELIEITSHMNCALLVLSGGAKVQNCFIVLGYKSKVGSV